MFLIEYIFGLLPTSFIIFYLLPQVLIFWVLPCCFQNLVLKIKFILNEIKFIMRGDDSHSLCMACSNGNMRRDMVTTATYLLPLEVDHESNDDIHPFYVYGHVFDCVLLIHSSIHYSVVEVIFSVQCLPCSFLQLQWVRLRCNHMGHCLNFPHMV